VRDGALALFASNVYAKLVPSIGICLMPSDEVGSADAGDLEDRRTTSITWMNCSRKPPLS
jgi:hypothetical protein